MSGESFRFTNVTSDVFLKIYRVSPETVLRHMILFRNPWSTQSFAYKRHLDFVFVLTRKFVQDGDNPLLSASRHGHGGVVRLLLKAKAGFNATEG